jgi:hypothetical protein
MKRTLLVAMVALAGIQAKAFNFHELNVYGYETADPHEAEFENASSVSSNNVLRSSFEVNYGLTDSLEAAVYADYTKADYEKTELTAIRSHVRKSFFKRGEMPVDMAANLEVEIPQDSDESYAVEGKFIMQKDWDRITLSVAPGVEFVKLKEKDDEGKDTETEKNVSSRFKYNYSDRLQPHLSYIAEISDEDPVQLALAGFDYEIRHGFSFTLGAGATNQNENIMHAAVELEVY